jgi:hypothetical protein
MIKDGDLLAFWGNQDLQEKWRGEAQHWSTISGALTLGHGVGNWNSHLCLTSYLVTLHLHQRKGREHVGSVRLDSNKPLKDCHIGSNSWEFELYRPMLSSMAPTVTVATEHMNVSRQNWDVLWVYNTHNEFKDLVEINKVLLIFLLMKCWAIIFWIY